MNSSVFWVVDNGPLQCQFCSNLIHQLRFLLVSINTSTLNIIHTVSFLLISCNLIFRRGRDLYGSWIYNYICNQCLSPLMLPVRIPIRVRRTTICDKACQWLATSRWFPPGPPVSSTNKTDHHDITEILLKVALKIIKQPIFSVILHTVLLWSCLLDV